MRNATTVTRAAFVLLLGMSLPANSNDADVTTTSNQTPKAEPAAAAPCANCGSITRIEAKKQEGKGTGLGAATGAVLGAIAGRELVHGKRSNRNAAAVVGAVGGGYAGHKIEENVRTSTNYLIHVEMDTDQRSEKVGVESIESWTIGDKVRIENGTLVKR